MAEGQAEMFREGVDRIVIKSRVNQDPERVKAVDVGKGKTDETIETQNEQRPHRYYITLEYMVKR
jgi:hypothetical protein